MLVIVKKYRDLNIGQLMNICVQSCCESGKRNYPQLSDSEQFLRAQGELYQYLQDDFFQNEDTFCAFWKAEGHYVSTLRIEPYRDGLVLSALETAPQMRGRGYAKSLVGGVCDLLRSHTGLKLYSHIDRNNLSSVAVHVSCGFQKVSDCAVYLDGSVSDRADTYLLTVK